MKFEVLKDIVDGTDTMIVKPIEVLSDAQYDSIKHIVESMGGHWREKLNGFVFYTGYIHKTLDHMWREENQFFPTPENLSNRVVELSGIRNMVGVPLKILEPSAGSGALLRKLPLSSKHTYTVIEPEEKNVTILEGLGFKVNACTFEEYCRTHKNKFTHVIMNPPFSHSRDIKHVMMAYDLLEDGGRLVAIVSENSMYYKNEHSERFRNWLKEVGASIETTAPGSFKESGTMVDTVIITVNKSR